MKNLYGVFGQNALIQHDAEYEHTRQTLREIIDYAIVEGAMIKAPHFVHYLEMARLEIEHWRPPCPTCGRPMRDCCD